MENTKTFHLYGVLGDHKKDTRTKRKEKRENRKKGHNDLGKREGGVRK